MADDEESEEPAVVLGDSVDVEGVPLAQVSARLMWGIEKSAIEAREGETVVRTPDGPQELQGLLSELEMTYFATRQEFEDAIEEVVGHGPVPTPGTEVEEGTDSEESEHSEESEKGEETEEGEE